LISGKKKQKDINIDQIGYCSYFSSIKEKTEVILLERQQPIEWIILISFEKELSNPSFDSINDAMEMNCLINCYCDIWLRSRSRFSVLSAVIFLCRAVQ